MNKAQQQEHPELELNPPMPPEPSVTIDDLIVSAQRALDAMHTTTDSIAAIAIRAQSDDGSVSATVDASGTLRNLQLDDTAMDMNADRLSELIIETAQRAAKIAFTELHQHIAQLNHRLGNQPSFGTTCDR